MVTFLLAVNVILLLAGNFMEPSSIVLIFAPVSYTHLRAHETVLDIVCRLLLEKKNNNLSDHVLLSLHF